MHANGKMGKMTLQDFVGNNLSEKVDVHFTAHAVFAVRKSTVLRPLVQALAKIPNRDGGAQAGWGSHRMEKCWP